jgi:hypothetical protein
MRCHDLRMRFFACTAFLVQVNPDLAFVRHVCCEHSPSRSTQPGENNLDDKIPRRCAQEIACEMRSPTRDTRPHTAPAMAPRDI